MPEILVQGDTAPDFVVVLHAPGNPGEPLDLTEADTIKFTMRKPDDRRHTVNGAAEIVGDPTDGRVKYVWGDSDLNVPGTYQGRFEVTYIDGKIQSQRTPTEITVERQ